MKIRELLREISIVVLGSIDKEQCNPLWLAKHNVISEEEVRSIDNNSLVVSKDLVQFRTRQLEVLCDGERLQIRSKDVSLSNILSGVVKGIIDCCGGKVNAIGINAMLRVSFLKDSDFLLFNHHIAPLDGLYPLSPNALLSNITVSDWSEKEGNGVPKKTFNIQRIPSFDKNCAAVQISMNAHFAIESGSSAVVCTLDDAARIQSEFFKNAQQFLESLE